MAMFNGYVRVAEGRMDREATALRDPFPNRGKIFFHLAKIDISKTKCALLTRHTVLQHLLLNDVVLFLRISPFSNSVFLVRQRCSQAAVICRVPDASASMISNLQ